MAIRGAHLAVEKLSHSFSRSAQPVLRDIDLEVQPGQCVAIIGRSGCGKSTLLHMMAGLLKPTAGGVRIDGARISAPSPEWVMMFQAPCLYPWMSVAENVGLGLRFAGKKREMPGRVKEMLDLVQLGSLASRNVQDLSGGQQQRVALARSLATSPRVLLLDEPFSALDAFTRHSLQRDIRQITQALEITTVIVTHDISEAARMADRAIIMNAAPGSIAADCDVTGRANATAEEHHRHAVEALTVAYEQATGISLNHTNGSSQLSLPADTDPSSQAFQPATANGAVA